MRPSGARSVGFPFFLALAVATAGCSESGLAPNVELLTVVLHSLPSNDLPVHVVIGTEDQALDDSNRLVPGQSREVVMRVDQGDFLLFRAARELGPPLAATSCEVVDATGEGFVFWDGSRLDCDNALMEA